MGRSGWRGSLPAASLEESRDDVAHVASSREDGVAIARSGSPAAPTRSLLPLEPLCVLPELEDWPQHSDESVLAMQAGLAKLWEAGEDRIID